MTVEKKLTRQFERDNGDCRTARCAGGLSAAGIRKYLRAEYSRLNIEVTDGISSTNTVVRRMAEGGEKDGYVLAAGVQSSGRGRMGRSFFSPSGTGVYFSLLLRPDSCPPARAARFTTMAAVSACGAIEAMSEEHALIKWVNDVFVRGKKVCGILTEASVSLETELLEYAVLGVGINLYVPQGGFPAEIEQTAGAAFSSPVRDAGNRFTGEFLNRFMRYCLDIKSAEYAAEYRRRSLVLGKKINVISAGTAEPAEALDVDDSCRLLVRYESGLEELLSSGEISIRL